MFLMKDSIENNSIENLYLIGNGFDLAHGLPTSYKDFLDFCKMVRELYTYPIIDNEYNQKKLIDWTFGLR